MDNAKTAAIIKSRCKDKAVTISALLEDIGIRKSLIYDMEKRDKTPSSEVLEQIADYLDCSVDYLLGRTDVPEVNQAISETMERDNAAPGGVGGLTEAKKEDA